MPEDVPGCLVCDCFPGCLQLWLYAWELFGDVRCAAKLPDHVFTAKVKLFTNTIIMALLVHILLSLHGYRTV